MLGLIFAAVILAFILPRQFRLRPILRRQLVVVPSVALAAGLFVVIWEDVSFSSNQLLYIGLQLIVAVIAGTGRGFAIRVVARGPIGMRVGGWALAAAWVGTIVGRLAIDGVLRVVAGGDTAIVSSLPLFLGLTIATQNAILALRMKHAGLRFLTTDDRRRLKERRERWRARMP